MSLLLKIIIILSTISCTYGAEQVLSDWQPGIAIHFQGPQDVGQDQYDPKVPAGSCGYGELDPKLYPFWGVASIARQNPIIEGEQMSGCGACFEVQCLDTERCKRRNTTNVMITDTCGSGCVQQQLNMHVFSFQYLSPSKWGEIPIRFRRISCDPPGGLIVRITDYRESQGGWIRLVVLDAAGSGDIASIQLRKHNTNQWKQMSNYYGAAWELSILPEPPFDLQVTRGDGERIYLENVIDEVRVGGFYESQVQFEREEPSKSFRDFQMFPTLSMPPLEGSSQVEGIGVTPQNISNILPQQRSSQGNMPLVSLDQLLNPSITLTPTSDREVEDEEEEQQDQVQKEERQNEETNEDVIVLNLYQALNDTDWEYLRRAFERIGFLEPASELNS